MTDKERNDLFYVCSLIEFIGRLTKNRRGNVVKAIGEKGMEKLLYDAEVNHCLSFEQVGDEVIEHYRITEGDYDTITNCKYTVPSYTDIGDLYSILIEDCYGQGKEVAGLMDIFSSFISDAISDFRTGIYYENPSYLEASFREGYLLE